MKKTLAFSVGLALLIGCGEKRIEITPGNYVLTNGYENKPHLIGCIAFLKNEQPFRIRVINGSEVEFYPAISRPGNGNFSMELVGFMASFEFHGRRILISPFGSKRDTIGYEVLHASSDSLVLKDWLGNREVYERKEIEQENFGNHVWKIEVETSPNISSCRPYHLFADSTGTISFSRPEYECSKTLSEKETRALFERINQCNYAQSKQTQSEGEDERIVTVKVWGNNGYLELKGEPVYFSLELKRFLLIFDDYVYNYSETKQLILQ